MRFVGAGDDQKPGRVAVEAVDDPRPLGFLPARDRVREEPVDERAARVASPMGGPTIPAGLSTTSRCSSS